MTYEKASVPAADPPLAVEKVKDVPATMALRYGDVAAETIVAAEAVSGESRMTLPAVTLVFATVTLDAAGKVNCPVPNGNNRVTAVTSADIS